MPPCAVKFCPNESKNTKKCDNVSYHRFPMDPDAADLWTRKIRLNRQNEFWKPTQNSRICSSHFSDKYKYMTKKGICKLHPNAVPTKNLSKFCINSDSEEDDNLPYSQSQQSEKSKPPEIRRNKRITSRDVNPSKEVLKEFLHFNTSRREILLRIQLERKISLQVKHTKLINTMRKQNQRLKERNKVLKQRLIQLRKESKQKACTCQQADLNLDKDSNDST